MDEQDDDTPPVDRSDTRRIHRRHFLNLATVAAGTVVVSGLPALSLASDGDVYEWRGLRTLVRQGRRYFPQSVASFDPRPESVLLWARLQDDDRAGSDLALRVVVGTDQWLRRVVLVAPLVARVTDDGVVQVKVTGLEPGRSYYYRFVYETNGDLYGSALARTRTAPRPSDRAPVRFVLASCQDAIGRFYNPYLAVLSAQPDFVLHVGDYIYETTGDSSFQSTGGRGVAFTDLGGAIALGTPAAPYYAAASVSNYRELYRFYRSDSMLQRVHERFPFVNIWDDHEYSDDCWQATGTYLDGRADEHTPERRRNAEQVFYEYIGVDVDGALPEGEVDQSGRALYPDGRLYRDLRWGKNLHLLLTDSRSYRPDHLIPEDAFPGTVVVDRAVLTTVLGAQGISYDAVKSGFAPYFDLSEPAYAPLQPALVQILTGAYLREGLAPAVAQAKAAGTIQGKLDVRVINALLAAASLPPIGSLDTLDRGISFALMGKTALFSELGSRYVVAKEPYDIYAAVRGLADARSLDVYDSASAPLRPQLQWLTTVLATSNARWKVIANSTSLTSMVLDLTGQAPGLPPEIQAALEQLPAELRARLYLSVDQMDGFPAFTKALLGLYAEHTNVVLVAGDIHASFAAEHAGHVWEFTGPAVSSQPFRASILGVVQADPTLSQIPGLADLVGQLDVLLRASSPDVRYAKTDVNGIVILDVAPAKLTATYWQLDGAEAGTAYYEDPLKLQAKRVLERFEIPAR